MRQTEIDRQAKRYGVRDRQRSADREIWSERERQRQRETEIETETDRDRQRLTSERGVKEQVLPALDHVEKGGRSGASGGWGGVIGLTYSNTSLLLTFNRKVNERNEWLTEGYSGGLMRGRPS